MQPNKQPPLLPEIKTTKQTLQTQQPDIALPFKVVTLNYLCASETIYLSTPTIKRNQNSCKTLVAQQQTKLYNTIAIKRQMISLIQLFVQVLENFAPEARMLLYLNF
eukprot:TRINITY_DN3629_c0_g1_i1.p5 TRINITY_DN3629_c0_g1~~TRINITY_DN3629_c0_g1_i1.p5  ORF type:complete len:107 (+),score=3.36 TRINITY_DN3629_c0_g1_i1:140-460(+)